MGSFWEWWQYLPAKMDPVIFTIGSFQLRWYGTMYIVAFAVTYILTQYRVKDEDLEYSQEVIENFFMYAIIGVLVGGRLGYVLFYNFGYYLLHPLEIILPVRFGNGVEFTGISGMSYHGGVIGVILAFVYVSKKHNLNFFRFTDLVAPAIPLGYMFGRIGNFINGELYGRVTDVSWGMYFPLDPTGQLRHPSQLYEAFFEGLFLFAILWIIRKRTPFQGFLPGLYLIGYGVVRFFIEFYRMPDEHLGLVFLGMTAGQILCLAMIAGGVVFWRLAKRAD
ncbi:MAG: prolipoprotein diacylglyceryl transferase [Candidatus Marinimicrobia bacterium]|nr:prolipoprotein diacylglyceryl transferase [Candidatus Neomarinimicrobiota bacterium]MCF7830195.1 prolipoprotein diacylglyceryl transferase [Candidatus Neomarinimicrobiota bacterium]MCF7882071.1 prolipoprotein diacylglyceryl transferase [Candidatus Neomarinimicrobiota bacterium]